MTGRENNYYSISQVSELFNIPASTLRFYDKVGLYEPAVKNESTGYRYYSDEQFNRLETIIMLREFELPIKEIIRILDGRERRQELAEALDDYIGHIKQKIERQLSAMDQLSDIVTRLRSTEPMSGIFRVKELERRSLICVRADGINTGSAHRSGRMKKLMTGYKRLFAEKAPRMLESGMIAESQPGIDRYYVQYEFMFVEFDASVDVLPKGFTKMDVPAGRYITYEFCVNDTTIASAYHRLERYLKENGIKTEGPFIELTSRTGIPALEKKDEFIEIQMHMA